MNMTKQLSKWIVCLALLAAPAAACPECGSSTSETSDVELAEAFDLQG